MAREQRGATPWTGTNLMGRPVPLDSESHGTALDSDQPGAGLVAVGLGQSAAHALISVRTPNAPWMR
jgi:hypothetical protein